jgi:hypothetical protein
VRRGAAATEAGAGSTKRRRTGRPRPG